MAEPTTPRSWAWLVLFTSSTTLICCALPILLVTLGFGAVSAALFANLPFLVTMAQHKSWMFSASGAVLALAAWLLYRPGRSCPADPQLIQQCEKTHRWNIRFFWIAIVTWWVGFASAYLTLPIYLWLDG